MKEMMDIRHHFVQMAIELLKKGEGKITGVGSSIENLVCSEIERNLEYF